ncbi:hypothetical protein [Streptacidiphilus sp. EB129]|uniref:hypothetical protein n=1 Tax=Streptacidiphilus sp. EB129 TaxID=3156262 RepID=UPI003516F7BB
MIERHAGVRRLCLAVSSGASDLLASACRMGGFDRLQLLGEPGRGIEVAVAPPGVDEIALIRDLLEELHGRIRARPSGPGGPVLMAVHVGIIRVVGDGFGGTGVARTRELVLAPAVTAMVCQAEREATVSVVVSDSLFADLRAEGLPGDGWRPVASAAGWLRTVAAPGVGGGSGLQRWW